MSRILIDLDHTLLDTTRFKTALAQSLHLTRAEWDMAYRKFLNDYKLFNPEDFLQGVTTPQREAFEHVVKKIQTFLYPDSAPFLKQAIAQGHEVIIVTFGNKLWQEQKLRYLLPFLPKSVKKRICTTQKVNEIQDILGQDVVLIDDRADEIDAIATQFSETVVYWIQRPNGKYRDQKPVVPHTIITSLSEINLH